MKPFTKVQKTIVFACGVAVCTTAVALVFKALLIPVLIALFFAYLLHPVVLFMQKQWRWPKMVAIIIALGSIVFLITGAIAGLIPVVRMEFKAIVSMMPQAKALLLEQVTPWLVAKAQWFGVSVPQWRDFSVTSQLGHASTAVTHIFSRTGDLFSWVVTIGFVPFFLFFILYDYEKLGRLIWKLIPHDLEESADQFVSQVDQTLKSILKRQLAVALILSVLYSIGFSLVGLKFSLAVGVVSGICRIVPYLDVLVAIVLSSVIILTEPALISWQVPVGVAAVILIVQALDGMLITPKVVGDRVGLPTAMVIASVIAFGDWLGFVGVLIAIPLAAILKIILAASIEAYWNSTFFKGSK